VVLTNFLENLRALTFLREIFIKSALGGCGEMEGEAGLGGIGIENVLLEWISTESALDKRLTSEFESSEELLVW